MFSKADDNNKSDFPLFFTSNIIARAEMGYNYSKDAYGNVIANFAIELEQPQDAGYLELARLPEEFYPADGYTYSVAVQGTNSNLDNQQICRIYIPGNRSIAIRTAMAGAK